MRVLVELLYEFNFDTDDYDFPEDDTEQDIIDELKDWARDLVNDVMPVIDVTIDP